MKFQFKGHFSFDLNPPIWTRLFRSVCLNQLFEPIFWTRLFGLVYLDPSIWTCLFGPIYLDLFKPVFLDLSFWIHLLFLLFPLFLLFQLFLLYLLYCLFLLFLLFILLLFDFCLLVKKISLYFFYFS